MFTQYRHTLILSGAIILAVVIGGTFYLLKNTGSNTLTVTGSARLSVVSDKVIWRSSISRTVYESELKNGYAQVSSDLRIVQAFLKQSGIAEDAITVTPVTVMQEWNQDGNAPRRYTLRQSIEVQSAEVEKITAISKNVQKVVEQGAFFQTDAVEYYYTPLADARVNLLTDAITDARARAAAMAKSSRQSVGKLQSASSGVVQVLSAGAVDNGEYGQYDTSKINKDITVTVRAVFRLK